MTTEYQDSIREGFEVYIAKQLKLEAVSKAVLAVQVFAMKGEEYADKKLQMKWGEWNTACRHQIEMDAEICKEIRQNIAPGNQHFRHNDTYKLGYLESCEDAEVAIRHQGKS